MQASFDGMRRGATNGMNSLHGVLSEVLKLDSYDGIRDDLKERLIEAYNNAAQSVDVMNCLYDPNVEGDMNDLSDVLSVDRLDEIEESE